MSAVRWRNGLKFINFTRLLHRSGPDRFDNGGSKLRTVGSLLVSLCALSRSFSRERRQELNVELQLAMKWPSQPARNQL